MALCSRLNAWLGSVRQSPRESGRIQVNLIAQNYVENPVYYPEALRGKPSFQASLARQVPLGRLATAREDAQFALFLASDESDFFVGQAIPFTGGWIQR